MVFLISRRSSVDSPRSLCAPPPYSKNFSDSVILLFPRDARQIRSGGVRRHRRRRCRRRWTEPSRGLPHSHRSSIVRVCPSESDRYPVIDRNSPEPVIGFGNPPRKSDHVCGYPSTAVRHSPRSRPDHPMRAMAVLR